MFSIYLIVLFIPKIYKTGIKRSQITIFRNNLLDNRDLNSQTRVALKLNLNLVSISLGLAPEIIYFLYHEKSSSIHHFKHSCIL